MAFIGTPLDTRNTFQSLQGKRFNGDGSTTAFTLDVAPSSTLDIEVFVGNVRQDPNSAYTLSGTTLTFTGAPPSGTNNIYVVHQAKSVGTIDPPATESVAKTFSSTVSFTGAVTSSSTVQLGGTADMNGTELILDADGDTSITADTDDQIDFKTGGTDRAIIDSSGNVKFNSGFGSVTTVFGCRAWANVDQTGTTEIQGSGGVSSVTDTGVGATDVNFSTNMPDGDYCMMIAPGSDLMSTPNQQFGVAVGNDGVANVGKGVIASRQCDNDAATFTTADASQICVAFFR